MTSKPNRPLASDFAHRLEALRLEAAEAGHSDLHYLVEMAVDIARRRVGIQFKPTPTAEAEDRLPN